MRLSEVLISTALMSLALNTVQATTPTDPKGSSKPDGVVGLAANPEVRIPLAPVPSPLIVQDKVMASAYYDTLSILSTFNRCSEFFGGPAAAVDIFDQMIGQVRKDYVSAAIGMEMSGQIVDFFNFRTQKRYRLFDKIRLNANGPFYRRGFSPVEARVGSFEPSTREARVLIFLHELGHLIKGPDGSWLLPNDGNDEALSLRNSKTVENICGDEINGLGTSEAALNLAKRVKAEAGASEVQSAPQL